MREANSCQCSTTCCVRGNNCPCLTNSCRRKQRSLSSFPDTSSPCRLSPLSLGINICLSHSFQADLERGLIIAKPLSIPSALHQSTRYLSNTALHPHHSSGLHHQQFQLYLKRSYPRTNVLPRLIGHSRATEPFNILHVRLHVFLRILFSSRLAKYVLQIQLDTIREA